MLSYQETLDFLQMLEENDPDVYEKLLKSTFISYVPKLYMISRIKSVKVFTFNPHFILIDFIRSWHSPQIVVNFGNGTYVINRHLIVQSSFEYSRESLLNAIDYNVKERINTLISLEKDVKHVNFLYNVSSHETVFREKPVFVTREFLDDEILLDILKSAIGYEMLIRPDVSYVIIGSSVVISDSIYKSLYLKESV